MSRACLRHSLANLHSLQHSCDRPASVWPPCRGHAYTPATPRLPVHPSLRSPSLQCTCRVGAALVCASSFVIVRFEARSKEALPPMDLKAKDSARLELAADSHWQRLEAGVGGAASLRAAGGDAEGQLELAEAWRGSVTAAAAAAAAAPAWQGQGTEQHGEDERAPLVRPPRPRSAPR